MKIRKVLTAGVALAAVGAIALTGCSAGSGGGDNGGKQTLTVWQNSTTGDGKQFWTDAAAAFHKANPDVTIKVTSIQNEDMDGKLQTAVNSGDMPDIFMARGGSKLADIVAAGKVKDLTDKIDPNVKKAIGDAAFSAFTIDGKVYGVPTAVLPGGVFYSKDLFAKAGITATPKTMDDLEADIAKLKAAGIAPIALGAKDAWPAAHWYYFFAVRACGKDLITNLATKKDFKDGCWLTAANNLEKFAKIQPFNEGFLTTSAQQGANSSAGLVANHKAAMELMGAWDPGVIASLTPDQKPLADLDWFPFPEVSGGKGRAGRDDGRRRRLLLLREVSLRPARSSSTSSRPRSGSRSTAMAFQTIPANQDAKGAVDNASLKPLMAAYGTAPYVALWLDTALGQNVGNALNTGVVEMLAGQGDPKTLIQKINDAAARG